MNTKNERKHHFKMEVKFHEASGSHTGVSFSAYKAFFFAFLSGLCFSTNAVLVRLAKDTPPMQMSMYRFIGMLFFSLPIAVYNGSNLIGPKGSRLMLLFRAAAAVTTVFCLFLAFHYLPIGQASVIVFSTPVFVTIFAKLLLKETCGLVQAMTVGLTIAGIILIINPSDLINQTDIHAVDHTIGVLFGIGGLFCQCSMVLLTRQTRNVHYSVVCVTTSAVGTVVSLALVGSAFHLVLPRCGLMRWVAIGMGVFSSMGQIFLIKALQMENAGPVATLKAAVDITVAIIWQIVIFQESLSNFAISGSALVITSVILLGVRKWVLMLPENSPTKRKFRFLTY